MSFVSVLAQQGKLTVDQLQEVTRLVTETGQDIEEVLAGFDINELDILWAKGNFYNVPVRIIRENVPFEILQYISHSSAEHYQIVPLAVKNGLLEVGVLDPDNVEMRDAVHFLASKHGMPYKLFLISPEDFKKTLVAYEGLKGQVDQALDQLETELDLDESQFESEDGDTKEEAPITKIVATIVRYAVDGMASDVHVEHVGTEVRVRYRVDGDLHTSLVVPANVHSALVARIKILSNMRLDEKRKPQDGRFSAHINGRKVDFRVSTLPSYYGEKVVMRILDTQRGVRPLDTVGLSVRDLGLIRNAISRPHGMILISGPTGSGKTTTLYSMLNELDKDTKNVLSLEDPVEYNVPGITQSQVKPEIGFTFASGLRTTLRQDPDIIMVGEIRDKETAQLAIQAALTGHLVLSTIHTNSAGGIIPRLVDMGVDPYLIAPTLILGIAQRLTRTLCGEPEHLPLTDARRMLIDNEMKDIPEVFRNTIAIPEYLVEAQSTDECPTGTKGRTAVFEVMDINDEMERIILDSPNEDDIMTQARTDGMLTIREDALIKSFAGIIPYSEVNKL